jgi:hypothetical protein
MTGGSRRVWWFRRPRRPPPALLDDPRTWLFAAVVLPLGFLFGMGVVMTEQAWSNRAGGVLCCLVSVVAGVALIGYLVRPVDWFAVDEVTAAWADALDRGRDVEVGLSRRKVLRACAAVAYLLTLSGVGLSGWMGPVGVGLGVLLAAIVLAGLLPHIETATATGPALRVDSRGIEIARWTPVRVPWSEVAAVRAHANTQTVSNVVVHPSGVLYAEYMRSRPLLLRLSDIGSTWFSGDGFMLPQTIDADPDLLAAWLDAEAQQRRSGLDGGPSH